MFLLPQTVLDQEHSLTLRHWQENVDAAPDYPNQVSRAKAKFSQYNVRGNDTFAHVKAKLEVMCCGGKRCSYCEDSMADEVEHIYPKDLYPEVVFNWNNYVFACGTCNGPKSSHFALHLSDSGRCRNVTRRRRRPVVPPASGTPLLINPREEDPLEFLLLDLSGTFHFLPKPGLSFRQRQRARYTIYLLQLNRREPLVNNRRNACRNYIARLREYIDERDRGGYIAAYPVEFRAMDHRSVWLEMKRQRADHQRLSTFFNAAPEALGW